MSAHAGEASSRACVVVDDHAAMVAATSAALESAGYSVVRVASTGGDALAEIASVQPAFAVIDLHLPDTTGIELAARLRSAVPRTALVLHTAHLGSSTVADALAVGVRGVVLKGNVERLLDAVRDVRRGALYVDPAIARVEP
jgi:DNA-binding NarL/FixJ family response regulator